MFKKIVAFLTIIVSISFLPLPLRINAQQASTSTAIQASIKSILANKDNYDHKEVLVEGKVTSLKFKTSKKGNDYANFHLSDIPGNSIRVFVWGHPSISESDRVEVKGIFYKVKYVGRYRFYDEIDAESIKRLEK